jgi:hypothetical protein
MRRGQSTRKKRTPGEAYLLHFTLVDDIKRDPFEQAVGIDQKTATSIGGALAAPATAFIYDWNLLPIGQQLWLMVRDPQGVPTPTGASELQPHSGYGADQERRRPSQ